jgi:hypothetical protein
MSFFNPRRRRRPPPSDSELRLRCIEASTRIAASSGAGDGRSTHEMAADAILVAQAYYAFIKGRSLSATMLPYIAKQNLTLDEHCSSENSEVDPLPRVERDR